jgi:hypothetical protein
MADPSMVPLTGWSLLPQGKAFDWGEEHHQCFGADVANVLSGGDKTDDVPGNDHGDQDHVESQPPCSSKRKVEPGHKRRGASWPHLHDSSRDRVGAQEQHYPIAGSCSDGHDQYSRASLGLHLFCRVRKELLFRHDYFLIIGVQYQSLLKRFESLLIAMKFGESSS